VTRLYGRLGSAGTLGSDLKRLCRNWVDYAKRPADGVVLVPVFGGATDEPALRTLAAWFPGRRIEPVDCQELVRGRGALHCITRDQPVWPA
jgi:agmatine/peptidylarginine deiminase